MTAPALVRTRAALDHVAIVRKGAYAGAGVVGVRTAAEAEHTLRFLALLRGRG
jgi:hypothetical protein